MDAHFTYALADWFDIAPIVQFESRQSRGNPRLALAVAKARHPGGELGRLSQLYQM